MTFVRKIRTFNVDEIGTRSSLPALVINIIQRPRIRLETPVRREFEKHLMALLYKLIFAQKKRLKGRNVWKKFNPTNDNLQKEMKINVLKTRVNAMKELKLTKLLLNSFMMFHCKDWIVFYWWSHWKWCMVNDEAIKG